MVTKRNKNELKIYILCKIKINTFIYFSGKLTPYATQNIVGSFGSL